MTIQAAKEAVGEGPSGSELRRSRRLGCKGFAEAFAPGSGYLFRGEIRDISTTGCYLLTSARLKLELRDELDLLFILNNHYYHAVAFVMNFQPGKGVGLEFQFGDSQTEQYFNTLIQLLIAAEPPKQD